VLPSARDKIAFHGAIWSPIILMPSLLFLGAGLENIVFCFAGGGFAFLLLVVVAAWRVRSRLLHKRMLDGATEALQANDIASAVALCQRALAGGDEWGTAERALYLLGHCAETARDFAESEELFGRAMARVPWSKRTKWHTILMESHRSLALVALRRVDEAEMAVGRAIGACPAARSTSIFAYPDDMGVDAVPFELSMTSEALLSPGRRTGGDIEPRDPRDLLALARAVVLAARGRGREAIEVIESRRGSMSAGLLPRERALLVNAESHAYGLVGGPLRLPAVTNRHPWADSILPPRA
jgi:hypothetical protein